MVEFGSGYGTFTIPAARRTMGIVNALDVESSMVEHLRRKAEENGLTNIHVQLRDFVADGTGLDSDSQVHAMIFNLLHIEYPLTLLKEAYRILSGDGLVSIIHWRSDIPTPRGPPVEIRPTVEQCRA